MQMPPVTSWVRLREKRADWSQIGTDVPSGEADTDDTDWRAMTLIQTLIRATSWPLGHGSRGCQLIASPSYGLARHAVAWLLDLREVLGEEAGEVFLIGEAVAVEVDRTNRERGLVAGDAAAGVGDEAAEVAAHARDGTHADGRGGGPRDIERGCALAVGVDAEGPGLRGRPVQGFARGVSPA